MKHESHSQMVWWILVANLTIMLFPPIHLFFASGSMPMALFFFFGSGILLVISMMVLRAIDPSTEKEE